MSTGAKARTYRIRQLPCILKYRPQVASFLASVLPDLAADNVRVMSLAASLNPLEIPATKVATVMFDRVPAAFDTNDTQWVIPGQSAGLVRDILVDLHFRDFTPLNDVLPDDHEFDDLESCIAIPGLASHPFGTWQQSGSRTSFMWLRDRLPKEMPNVRSIIYGYDTSLAGSESVKAVDDIAVALINKMRSIGRSNPSAKPLLVLAHSLGGIVLKQAIVMMARTGNSNEAMISMIRGAVFFGVPNKGMKTSHLLPMVQGQPNAHIVDVLSIDSDYLRSLDEQFSGIVTHRSIRILSIYETKRSATMQKTGTGQWRRDGPLDLLVKKSSAIQQSSDAYMPIDEDHSNIVKFKADDQDCQAILGFMSEVAAASTSKSSNAGNISSDSGWPRYDREEGDINLMVASLCHEETGYRLREIQTRYESTFEWIFEDEGLHFASWLRSPQELYWISGKPGSGKSTLMKLVRQDVRTYNLFREHDRGARHVEIDFFFHDRGSAVQKSLEGLLYSILYRLTSSERELANLVLAVVSSRPKTHRYTWSIHYLRQALEIILTQNRIHLRVLLFIDALDEFDGEPQTIVDFVKDMVRPRTGSTTKVKVCCSSRPWNVFRDAFLEVIGCRVHEHTLGDIRSYIDGRFKSNARMREMMQQKQQRRRKPAQPLKDALLVRAEGVFIWIRLVLDELLKACTDGAMLEELMEILSSIPDDLDKSYQRLIDRIPKDCRFESYVLIEVVLRSKDSLGLRDLGLVLMCAPGRSPLDSAQKLPSDPYSEEFLKSMRRRLQSRCGGMLEVLGDTTVQFMHQTAKDFFSRPGSTEDILRHDPNRLRENGYSFLTKFWLTLVTVPSQGFDWLSYILSMYRMNADDISPLQPHYVVQPHYLVANNVLGCQEVEERAREEQLLDIETTRLYALMSCAGFTAIIPRRRCYEYAYLAEVSTGRTQRDFIDDIPIDTMRVFFNVDFRKVYDFAKAAKLHLYVAEVKRERADRRARRRQSQFYEPSGGQNRRGTERKEGRRRNRWQDQR